MACICPERSKQIMKARILLRLFCLAILCAAPAFAQERSVNEKRLIAKLNVIKAEIFPSIENQCELFGDSDFKGTKVSFEVIDADFREILKLTNPFGCNFVIDESVEKKLTSVRVNAVPWNLVLHSVLESMDLTVKIEGSDFRIVNSPYYCERADKQEVKPTKAPLYTEFVKLNNLHLKTKRLKCWGSAPKIVSNEYENSDKLFILLRKMLSLRGAIEHDDRSGTLIITDEKERIEKIREFVKFLDESGFTLEEIVNNPNFEIK